MHQFRIGDRVRNVGSDGPEGKEGIIVMFVGDLNDESPTIGVQYDEPFYGGHDCSGQSPNYPIYKNGYCWWHSIHDLEVLSHGEEARPVKWRSVGPGIKGVSYYSDMVPVKE